MMLLGFFSSRDQNYALSNMAGGMPIKYNSIICNSSEQLYQACKYYPDAICVPDDAKTDIGRIPNVQARILASKNAMGSKITQKCAVEAGLVRDDWDSDKEIRIHAMLWALELKAIQNKKFRDALRITTGKIIVEISRKDAFWGCKESDGILKGKNVLGKLLMIVRNNLSILQETKQTTAKNGYLL